MSQEQTEKELAEIKENWEAFGEYKRRKARQQTDEQYLKLAKARIIKYGMPDVMTQVELAAALDVSLGLIQKWREAGVGPPVSVLPTNNGKYRYLAGEVIDWLKKKSLYNREMAVFRKIFREERETMPKISRDMPNETLYRRERRLDKLIAQAKKPENIFRK